MMVEELPLIGVCVPRCEHISLCLLSPRAIGLPRLFRAYGEGHVLETVIMKY